MKKNSHIPSEEDWGNYKNDLDQDYAHKIFFGKNLDEAMHLFEGAVLERSEELQFMPEIPFQYYIFAYCAYITSDTVLSNYNAPNAANGFLSLIQCRLRDDFDSIAPLMEELMPIAEYVAKNQALFRAAVEDYDDFNDTLLEIKRLAQG